MSSRNYIDGLYMYTPCIVAETRRHGWPDDAINFLFFLSRYLWIIHENRISVRFLLRTRPITSAQVVSERCHYICDRILHLETKGYLTSDVCHANFSLFRVVLLVILSWMLDYLKICIVHALKNIKVLSRYIKQYLKIS